MDIKGILGRQWQYPDSKVAKSNQADLVVSPPSCSLPDNDTILPSLWIVYHQWSCAKVHHTQPESSWF